MPFDSSVCSTVAKRLVLVAQIRAVAERHGARVEVSPRQREHYVRVSMGPWATSASLDGSSQVGALLWHWHTEPNTDVRYPEGFGITIQGTQNTITWGKATTFAETVEAFLAALDDGLGRLKMLDAVS